jgi:hypothetical protein
VAQIKNLDIQNAGLGVGLFVAELCADPHAFMCETILTRHPGFHRVQASRCAGVSARRGVFWAVGDRPGAGDTAAEFGPIASSSGIVGHTVSP